MVTRKAFENSLDQAVFMERGVSPVEDQPVPMGFGVSPDADQPGREVVETTSVVGLEDITFGVSPVEDQPLIVVVLGFPVVDEGIGFGVSPSYRGVVAFELAVVVFGFPVVDEGIGFGVSPSSRGVVAFELAVVAVVSTDWVTVEPLAAGSVGSAWANIQYYLGTPQLYIEDVCIKKGDRDTIH